MKKVGLRFQVLCNKNGSWAVYRFFASSKVKPIDCEVLEIRHQEAPNVRCLKIALLLENNSTTPNVQYIGTNRVRAKKYNSLNQLGYIKSHNTMKNAKVMMEND